MNLTREQYERNLRLNMYQYRMWITWYRLGDKVVLKWI